MNRLKLKLDDQPELACKKLRQELESEVNLNDFPVLPFEKILGYLPLEDLIKCRAVSRSWYHTIDSFRIKSLFFSDRPGGHIESKNKLLNGAFTQNFICSSRFEEFFRTFGQSIFSSLKHLRLYRLNLTEANRKSFTRALNSFGRLEELSIFWLNGREKELELNLPMLQSIWLSRLNGMKKLTLDAPNLQKVRLKHCSFSNQGLELVHPESAETLLIYRLEQIEVKKLKNLKYLYIGEKPTVDSTFLPGFEQLKEIHLISSSGVQNIVSQLFDQKRQYGRTDLKIYLCGLSLNGPDDPMIRLRYSDEDYLQQLAENQSRMADEILFCAVIDYAAVELVAPGAEMSVLKRNTGLCGLTVSRPVQDIERFLAVLENLPTIAILKFNCAQSQELFDRLPEHCAVQYLLIRMAPSDLGFLSDGKLKHLIDLSLCWSIDVETIRKVFEELQFLSTFFFKYNNENVSVQKFRQSKRFEVKVGWKRMEASDLNAAIQAIIANTESYEYL